MTNLPYEQQRLKEASPVSLMSCLEPKFPMCFSNGNIKAPHLQHFFAILGIVNTSTVGESIVCTVLFHATYAFFSLTFLICVFLSL